MNRKLTIQADDYGFRQSRIKRFTLDSAKKNINKAHDEFELRVKERTNKLFEVNNELIKEISVREKAEKKTSFAYAELLKKHNELKASLDIVLQQEKMASIGQLAAGVAHEINNPLGFISSNMKTLEKYVGRFVEFIEAQAHLLKTLNAYDQLQKNKKELNLDFILDDTKDLLKESLEGVKRISEIVQKLMTFSMVDDVHPEKEDINECLEMALNVIWNDLKCNVKVIKIFEELPLIKCYPQLLNQVFMNIIINASQASEEQGEITIKTWQKDGNLFVSISDTGMGIPSENINKIFDPFFTTKEVGKATGLGLSVSHEIIKRHNGEINVTSVVGRGAMFTMKLPVI